MNLMDVIEMVCGWIAASMRGVGTGDVHMDINKERFHIDDQMNSIIINTLNVLQEKIHADDSRHPNK